MPPRQPNRHILAAITVALNGLGLTMLLSLPAIWMAWSPAVLLLVVGTGAGAAVLYCVLYSIEDSWFGGEQIATRPYSARILGADSLERMTRFGLAAPRYSLPRDASSSTARADAAARRGADVRGEEV